MIPVLGGASTDCRHRQKLPSSCASVACSTRSGNGGTDQLCRLEPVFAAPPSSAAASQLMLNLGSARPPARRLPARRRRRTISCDGRFMACAGSHPMHRCSPCRRAMPAGSWSASSCCAASASRRNGRLRAPAAADRALSGSCVTRMLVAPLPSCAPSSAMATRRKVVSDRSAALTTASPWRRTRYAPSTPAACRTARVCRLPPPPPPGHRLAAVVAPADDLALAGGRGHAPGALAQHGVQQIPGVVAAQRAGLRRPRRRPLRCRPAAAPACVTWMRAWPSGAPRTAADRRSPSPAARARPGLPAARPTPSEAGLERSTMAVGG